ADTLRFTGQIALKREVTVDLAAQENRLYVASNDGLLRAFQVTGSSVAPLWSRSTVAQPMVPLTQGDRNLYVATQANLSSLDGATGGLRWLVPLSARPAGPVALYGDHSLVLATEAPELLVVRVADGAEAGRVALRAVPTAGPAVWGDIALVGYRDGWVEAVRLK
ncbi:MAG: PQQ-binding-like beta-propeller repeat protein, partial [Candidatus Eremiobacterota bacterium]